MSEITVRAPRRSDAATLARIWIDNSRYYAEMDPEFFQVPNDKGLVEWFEDYLDKPTEEGELRLVAELYGEVVGDLVAKILDPVDDADRQMLRELAERRLFVNAMGVDPAHWRTGVGTALMRAAEEWAKERGATRSGLDTYIDSPVSVPFYEKLGYKRHSINFRKQL